MLTARETLQAARYFAEEAKCAADGPRDVLRYNVEAVIVFARSVTFHLQKQLSSDSNFSSWYEDTKQRHLSNPVCAAMVKTRNFILKEGPTSISKQITVAVSENVVCTATFDASVRQGKPWWRRSPRILWSDAKAPVVRAIRSFQRWRRLRKSIHSRPRGTTSPVAERIYIDAPNLREHTLFEVLDLYLGALEHVLVEAERKFSAPSKNAD
jgi:hypothetical protein